MAHQGTPREVLLVGSVPLRPAEAVFEAATEHLGTLASRIPDGEQSGWIWAVRESLHDNPALEPSEQVPLKAAGRARISLMRLKEGLTAKDLTLGPYGYAENALASYRAFRALKDAGRIPQETRFQITMPGPGTSVYVVQLPPEELLPLARAALWNEVEQILEEAPAEELTFQFDIGMEAEHEEYLQRPDDFDAPIHEHFHWTREQMADSVAWLANRIPVEAELGFHICTIWHHNPEAGQDNAVVVETTNALVRRLTRPLTYVHIPIWPDHTEPEDYEPLKQLELADDTALFLGLINLTDGLDGAARRVELAKAAVPEFGVSFFCGLGHAPRDGRMAFGSGDVIQDQRVARATGETIGGLLDLHRDVANVG